MTWLPPFVVHGTHRITKEDLLRMGKNYSDILLRLAGGDFSAEEIKKHQYLNDWLSVSTKITG
jgi:glutathione-regulated potassium-efflux system ancillary protein KefG